VNPDAKLGFCFDEIREDVGIAMAWVASRVNVPTRNGVLGYVPGYD